MIESPSGRTPEKVPRWDLMGTEGCSYGKVVSWLPGCFQGIRVYIGEGTRARELRGAHEVGGVPYPLGAPSVLVAASWLLRLHLQVSWLSSGPRKIIAKFYSVWYSLSAKLKNMENRNWHWALG